MANQYDDDEDDLVAEETQQPDQNGPANLRKALKKAEREKKDLAEQLAKIQTDLRERSVKEVLATKGVPDKIAKFIPSDLAPDQIDGWLQEHSDVFGLKPKEDPAEAAEKEKIKTTNQRIVNATQSAYTPPRDTEALQKVVNAKSKEELDQLVFGQTLQRRR